jgi:hypothetical protein
MMEDLVKKAYEILNTQRPDRITVYMFLAFGILTAIMFAVLP